MIFDRIFGFSIEEGPVGLSIELGHRSAASFRREVMMDQGKRTDMKVHPSGGTDGKRQRRGQRYASAGA